MYSRANLILFRKDESGPPATDEGANALQLGAPELLAPLQGRLDPLTYMALRACARPLRDALPAPAVQAGRKAPGWCDLRRAMRPVTLPTALPVDEWWEVWRAISQMGPMRAWTGQLGGEWRISDSNRAGVGDVGPRHSQWVVEFLDAQSPWILHIRNDGPDNSHSFFSFGRPGWLAALSPIFGEKRQIEAPLGPWACCLFLSGTRSLFTAKSRHKVSVYLLEETSFWAPRVLPLVKDLPLCELPAQSVLPVMHAGKPLGFLQLERPATLDFQFYSNENLMC